MASTNKTSNYELPLFVGSDIPSWLTDWNGAMSSIDAALAAINSKAGGSESEIETIQSNISTLNQNYLNLSNSLSSAQSSILTLQDDLFFSPVTILNSDDTTIYDSGWFTNGNNLFSIKGRAKANSTLNLTVNGGNNYCVLGSVPGNPFNLAAATYSGNNYNASLFFLGWGNAVLTSGLNNCGFWAFYYNGRTYIISNNRQPNASYYFSLAVMLSGQRIDPGFDQ